MKSCRILQTPRSFKQVASHQFLLTAILLIGFFTALLCSQNAHSAEVTLLWDPPASGPTPLGYKLYYGLASGDYETIIDVGDSTTYTLTDLDSDTIYYFATTSYVVLEYITYESAFSNEFSWVEDTDPERFAEGDIGNAGNWSPKTPQYWTVDPDPVSDSKAYFLNNLSPYRHEFSVYDGGLYTNFTLTVKARTTDPSSVGWRDFYIIFAYQDQENYYFASFNTNNDDWTNGILKLQDGVITELSPINIPPMLSDEEYHTYQVIKSGNSITVKKDDSTVYYATDSTFSSGQIGVGSLNDSACFDDISIAVQRSLTTSSTDGGAVTTPGEGSFNYQEGAAVSVIAEAEDGFQFVNWTGTGVDVGKVVDPNSSSTTITMDGDYTLRANFESGKNILSTASSAGGYVLIPGEGQFLYDDGEQVPILAIPDANHHFVYWIGTGVYADKVADPNAPSTTITMDGDYTLMANFNIDQYSLSVSSSSCGYVSSPGEGIFTYGYGSTVVIEATPDADCKFVEWTGTGVDAGMVADPNSQVTTITINNDYDIRASFREDVSATFPFLEDFESGSLADYWTPESTADGRIRISGDWQPYLGDRHLLMDTGSDDAYSLNELVLSIDLSGQSNVFLEFAHKRFKDELHLMPASFTGSVEADGIAISEDGVTWHRAIDSLNGMSNAYEYYSIDLDEVCAAIGIVYNSSFKIKFQQYDNYQIDSDGYGFDDIAIASAGFWSADFPFTEDFESGNLAPYWYTNSTENGRIRVGTSHSPNGGSYQLLMDTDTEGSYSLNELILTINLSGQSNVLLDFYHKRFKDELHPMPASFTGSFPGDGIAVSEDGITWYRATDKLTGISNKYEHYILDLDAVCAAVGIDYSLTFKIKFQQYDDYPIDLDGYGFDDIVIAPAGYWSAGFPFKEDFESGDLASYWCADSDNAGRMMISESYAPNGGTKHLLMDSGTENTYSLNELVLNINLSARSNVFLSFYHKRFKDELHPMPPTFTGSVNADGIAVSEDGVTWHRAIAELSGRANTYEQYSVDLDAVCTTYGIDYNSSFKIKFQQYDNSPIDSDGYGFDDITVESIGKMVADFPFTEDFESGQLFNYWSTRSTATGRMSISGDHGPNGGDNHLLVDCSEEGPFSLNELVLTVDLSGQFDVYLKFYHMRFRDEPHSMPDLFTGSIGADGVAVSQDGVTWYKAIDNLNGLSYQYDYYAVALDKVCALNGINYNSTFKIKFQQYDNYPIDADGYGFDDIVIDNEEPLPNPVIPEAELRLFWQNDVTGDVVCWMLDESGSPEAEVPVATSSLDIKTAGDIDGDKTDDLILMSDSGRVEFWLIEADGTFKSSGLVGRTSTRDKIIASGDIDANGTIDIILRGSRTGVLTSWLLNADGTKASSVYLGGPVSDDWVTVASGDINADGTIDLFWRNTRTGWVAYWMLNPDGTLKDSGSIGSGPLYSSWQLVGAADVSADGIPDLLMQEDSGLLAYWGIDPDGSQNGDTGFIGFGRDLPGQVAGFGDIDSDDSPDIMWRDSSSGDISFWLIDPRESDRLKHGAAMGRKATSWKIKAIGK